MEKSSEASEVQQWASKMQILNKKKGSKQFLNLDIVALGKSHLRLDAQTPSGIQVATASSSPEEFQCQIYTQKTYYYGSTAKASLSPLIGFDASPRLVSQIFLNEPYDSSWECAQSPEGLKSCSNAQGMKINELERTAESRKIQLISANVEIQWVIKQPPQYLKPNMELFKIAKIESYRKVSLDKK